MSSTVLQKLKTSFASFVDEPALCSSELMDQPPAPPNVLGPRAALELVSLACVAQKICQHPRSDESTEL